MKRSLARRSGAAGALLAVTACAPAVRQAGVRLRQAFGV
jgi:hypothetical protein